MDHQHISDKVKEMTLHVLPRPPWLRGLQVHRNQFAMHQVCVTHLSPDWWSLDSLGDFGVTLSVSDTGVPIFLSCSLPFLTLSYCTTSVWRHSVIIIVSDTSPHPWTLHLTSGLTFRTSHSPHVFVCRLHLYLRLFFYFCPTSIFSLTIFNFNVPIQTTLGTDCDVYKTFSFGSLMSLNSPMFILCFLCELEALNSLIVVMFKPFICMLFLSSLSTILSLVASKTNSPSNLPHLSWGTERWRPCTHCELNLASNSRLWLRTIIKFHFFN